MKEGKGMDTREKAFKAAKFYLTSRGYKIGDSWKSRGLFGLIAMDKEEDELAFVQILYQDAGTLPEETDSNRTIFEKVATKWLASQDALDRPMMQVRFDIVSLLLLDGSYVFLRHHRNVLCTY